jgi:hypothetical protein
LIQYPALLRDLRATDSSKKSNAVLALTKFFSPHLLTNSTWNGLHIALLAKTAKTDRVSDFYAGKYKDYYCGRPGADFGPSIDILSRPDFQSSLAQLSTDPNALGTWLATYKAVYNYLGEKQ